MGFLVYIDKEPGRLEQCHEVLRQQLGLFGAENVVGPADDLIVIIELTQTDGADIYPVGVVAELVWLDPVVSLIDLLAELGLVQEDAIGIRDAEDPKRVSGKSLGLMRSVLSLR